jgi:hypothetical protein
MNDYFQATAYEDQVTDWTQYALNKVVIDLGGSETTETFSFRGGMLLILCQRCEKWYRSLYRHPGGRGLVCSNCATRIKKEMLEIKDNE